MIKLDSINLTLGKGTTLERHVLKDLSIHIADGEFVVLIGGNGAGKSTLFSLISGYRLPDNGAIWIDDQNVTKMPQHKRAAFVSEVMQDPKIGTMAHMTIEENLSFAFMRGRRRGLTLHDCARRRSFFREKLARLDMRLENRMHELVGNLSGGQRQALALIMAIVGGSKILMLDEITAALDPKTAANVMRIAADVIREEGRTTLMITHNMADAIHYGTRTILLTNGQIGKCYNRDEKAQLTPALLINEFSML